MSAVHLSMSEVSLAPANAGNDAYALLVRVIVELVSE